MKNREPLVSWVNEWIAKAEHEKTSQTELEKDRRRDQLLGTLNMLSEWYPDNLALINRTARILHQYGRMHEAARLYRTLADAKTSFLLTEKERNAVRRFAPNLYTLEDEPLPLKDFVAVLHPSRPCIAYHMFWENDWDFPDGPDNCDHEIVWVGLDDKYETITDIWSYFHGLILRTEESVEQARSEGMKPTIYVQWGKHGSILRGMEKQQLPWLIEGKPVMISGQEILHHSYLHSRKGGRSSEHPIKQGWPQAFEGTFEQYLDFSQKEPCEQFLHQPYRIMKTEWANAEMYTNVTPFLFSPKPEWPNF